MPEILSPIEKIRLAKEAKAEQAKQEAEAKGKLERERVAAEAKDARRGELSFEREQVSANKEAAEQAAGTAKTEADEARTIQAEMGADIDADTAAAFEAVFAAEVKANADLEALEAKLAQVDSEIQALGSDVITEAAAEKPVEAEVAGGVRPETAAEAEEGMNEEEIRKADERLLELFTELPNEYSPNRSEIFSAIDNALADKQGRAKLLATINGQLKNPAAIDPKRKKDTDEADVSGYLGQYYERLGLEINMTAADAKGKNRDYVSPEAKPLYQAAGDQLLKELQGRKEYGAFSGGLTHRLSHEIPTILANHKNAGGDPAVRQGIFNGLELIAEGNVEAQNRSGLQRDRLRKEDMNEWKDIQKLKTQFSA